MDQLSVYFYLKVTRDGRRGLPSLGGVGVGEGGGREQSGNST